MSLLDKITAELGLTRGELAKGNSHMAKLVRQDGVEDTEEYRRIAGLPRRPPNPRDDVYVKQLAKALTRKYARDWMELNEEQARALDDLYTLDGCFGDLPVGSGKTLLSYLAPSVWGADAPVLLVPANLRGKTIREFERLSKLWKVEPRHAPVLLGYEELGVVSGADKLARLEPDLIIADEAHKLLNVDAAVTRRVERYLAGREGQGLDIGLLLMSGTMRGGSLMRYWHLLRWVLGDNAPVPSREAEAQMWARAVDVRVQDGVRVAPGVLGETAEKARRWVADRISSTPGVVTGKPPVVRANLRIRVWSPALPQVLHEACNMAEAGNAPDGTLFNTEDDQYRCLRTLPLGFYHRWSVQPTEEWLRIRQRYFAIVRQKLAMKIPGLDSEKQVRDRFADAGWCVEWRDVASFEPPRETVWLEPTELPVTFPETPYPTIIWTKYRDPGLALDRLGMRYYANDGLDCDGRFIEDDPGTTSIVASTAANDTGRNLQHRWYRNLLLTQTSNPLAYEQLIGRTYRQGQEADTVYVTIYAPTARCRAAFFSAVEQAKASGSGLLTIADYE